MALAQKVRRHRSRRTNGSEKMTALYLKMNVIAKTGYGWHRCSRDRYYGVFPLRGKLLNVREARHKQLMENAEIQNIKKILGLQHENKYDSTKGSRYGHLMIMTDQVSLTTSPGNPRVTPDLTRDVCLLSRMMPANSRVVFKLWIEVINLFQVISLPLVGQC